MRIRGGLWRKRPFGAVAAPGADVDEAGPVQEAIHYGIDDGGIAHGQPPFLKADVGCHDERHTAPAGIDDIEEQVCVFGFWTHVAKGVEDQDMRPGDGGDDLIGRVVGHSAMKPKEQILCGEEGDAVSGLAGAYPEGRGQVGFSRAGLSEYEEGPALFNKAKMCKVFDVFHIEPGLETPVEGFESETFGKTRLLDAPLK